MGCLVLLRDEWGVAVVLSCRAVYDRVGNPQRSIAVIYRYTFTAAGVDLSAATAWQRMTFLEQGSEGPTGATFLSPQILSVRAWASGGTGSPILSLMLVDRAKDVTASQQKVVREKIACVQNGIRTSMDGTSGSYMLDCAFSSTATNKVDLVGINEKILLASGESGPLIGYIGCENLDGLTSVTVEVFATRCV